MKSISVIEVNKNRDGYFILDIREPYEYNFSNIKTTNIPMADVCERMNELPKDRPVVLMCKSGNRATALGNLLTVDYGFTNIYVMEGGICAWKELIDQTLIIE